ncbi:PAP2 domain protein [Cryomyces antarcticus]
MPSPPIQQRSSPVGQGYSLMASLMRVWQHSYASDYLGLAILTLALLSLESFIEPFHRMFSLDILAIQFPHAEIERVPPAWLFVYGGGVPLLVLLLWTTVRKPQVHKIHVTLLGLFIRYYTFAVVKNAVGRPRPDLIARCKPVQTPAHALVDFTVCTETNHHVLHDGWRSFPSGHSSFSFAGLGYLALFIAGQLHVFRPRSDFARALLALTPLVGAALIAISRCEDYRHDVYDVTCGSLLGFFVALFTYRRYYPRLRSSKCDVPYRSRSDTGKDGFGKVRDEERGTEDFGSDEQSDDDEERERFVLGNVRN